MGVTWQLDLLRLSEYFFSMYYMTGMLFSEKISYFLTSNFSAFLHEYTFITLMVIQPERGSHRKVLAFLYQK